MERFFALIRHEGHTPELGERVPREGEDGRGGAGEKGGGGLDPEVLAKISRGPTSFRAGVFLEFKQGLLTPKEEEEMGRQNERSRTKRNLKKKRRQCLGSQAFP
ncbi:hypothetical protein BT93_L3598 [Corymbia citriodora subsp. variegata]|uniref:Uncharacterized protein n=1 Tax=Corymbia citriodora subsp. variegata TaxID=360336 RepID=A0A8T0CHC3_CORYI|nr:hypothetical protein BT93_L3598 [Corymbia citriodora subsp. variegata]